MSREQVPYLGPTQRPSFHRQAWHMSRFINRAEKLSRQTFEFGLGSDIQSAFTGDDEKSKLELIHSNKAVPVLICAHDEMQKNNISKTLYALAIQQGVRLQPIVVDNASTDGTGKFAEQMGAIVVTEKEEGLMNSLRTGFKYLRDNGYNGPILHTDADAVPLPFWAKTLVDYAEANFPDGGEAYGPIIYYEADEHLLSPKNLIHTVGAKYRDRRVRRKGKTPVARGPNGIIKTDSGTEIFGALSTIKNRPGVAHETDIVVQSAVRDAGGTLTACDDSNATVIVSGRRVKNMLEMGLRIIAPEIAAKRAYRSWNGNSE